MKRFYRVKDGVRHGASNQFGPGDVIQLSDEEAPGLLDKLEPVEGGESEPQEPQQPANTPQRDQQGPAPMPVHPAEVVNDPSAPREALTVSIPGAPRTGEAAPAAPADPITKSDVAEAVKGAESADGGSDKGSGGGKRKA